MTEGDWFAIKTTKFHSNFVTIAFSCCIQTEIMSTNLFVSTLMMFDSDQYHIDCLHPIVQTLF